MAHLLVVDDNAALVENLVEILLGAGHTSTIFRHPAEALSCFHEQVYDAAILDYRMPELDGVELYKQLKQKDPALRAMIVSAYTNDECLQSARQQGIQEVLTKPFDIPVFLERLSFLLRAA